MGEWWVSIRLGFEGENSSISIRYTRGGVKEWSWYSEGTF